MLNSTWCFTTWFSASSREQDVETNNTMKWTEHKQDLLLIQRNVPQGTMRVPKNMSEQKSTWCFRLRILRCDWIEFNKLPSVKHGLNHSPMTADYDQSLWKTDHDEALVTRHTSPEGAGWCCIHADSILMTSPYTTVWNEKILGHISEDLIMPWNSGNPEATRYAKCWKNAFVNCKAVSCKQLTERYSTLLYTCERVTLVIAKY